jgi:hypothetical protein
MPPVEFEPTILVSERPKTHALDRTVTGIGMKNIHLPQIHLYTIRHWRRQRGDTRNNEVRKSNESLT